MTQKGSEMETYANKIQKLPGDLYTICGVRATLIRKYKSDEIVLFTYKDYSKKVCKTKTYLSLTAAQKAADAFLGSADAYLASADTVC